MKTIFFAALAGVTLTTLMACQTTPAPAPCTGPWFDLVESRVQVLDDAGHGPDVGSDEWMHAVDRKLGISDEAGHGPDLGSAEWCGAVNRRLFFRSPE